MGRLFLSGQTTCALLLGAGLLLRDGLGLLLERGLRAEEEAGAEEQCAGGLAGEEEASHAR